MDGFDRAFLSNFAEFGYMNHVVAAIALYNVGVPCEETASQLNAHVRQMPIEDPRNEAQKWNDGDRVRGIVSARLIAEFASAMEDFGALCEAIRYRHRKGLTQRFVTNSVGDVSQFFDRSLSELEANLEGLLCLPSRDDLKAQLPPDLAKAISNTYDEYPELIRQCASWYRSQVAKRSDAVEDSDSDSSEANGMRIMLEMPGRLHFAACDSRHPIVQAQQQDQASFPCNRGYLHLARRGGNIRTDTVRAG